MFVYLSVNDQLKGSTQHLVQIAKTVCICEVDKYTNIYAHVERNKHTHTYIEIEFYVIIDLPKELFLYTASLLFASAVNLSRLQIFSLWEVLEFS